MVLCCRDLKGLAQYARIWHERCRISRWNPLSFVHQLGEGFVMKSQTSSCKFSGSTYEAAYEATKTLMAPCCIAELQGSLEHLVPAARKEAAWGVVDALADLVLDVT